MFVKEKNIKKQKKRKILEKAFELFRKNGYMDTKVEDITKALGISKGSFYTYFKTKEELLCELLESMKNSEMERYSKVEIDENPKKTLENFIKERFKSKFFRAFEQCGYWNNEFFYPEYKCREIS